MQTQTETGSVMAASCASFDHEGCITCSDEGIPAIVLSIDGDDAVCMGSEGKAQSIAIELVSPVHIGEILLTHGGVAIGRGAK